MLQIPIDNTPKHVFEMKDKKSFRFYEIPSKIQNIMYYPSVTAICGYESDFTSWYSSEKNWREIQLFANTVGTFLHYKIQSYLANKWEIMRPPLDFSPIQQNAFNNWFDKFQYHPKSQNNEMGIRETTEKIMLLFEEFSYDYQPQPPKQLINGTMQDANLYPFEIKLHSERFGYAGSMDIITSLRLRNESGIYKNYILDLKTTYTDSTKYDLQLIAYYLAFRDIYPNIPIDEIGILYLAKDTKNYKYKFTTYDDKEMKQNRIKWLNTVKKFYLAYGENYPLTLSRNRILENIKNEGI
jgi:hypothetical protein